MNLNKAFILGRLTRDPESRTLPSGQPVVNFGVATNRFYTDQSGNKQKMVDFHNVVAFGKLADICSRYLSKGGLVLIEGRIQNRSWESQDGTKRNRTEIIAEGMQLGPRSAADSSASPTSRKSTSDSEDIPVIEQETPMNSEDVDEKDGVKDEVNVDNIPF